MDRELSWPAALPADGDAAAETRDDIRAITKSIQDDTERLRAIEAKKAQLDPSDARTTALAKEAEQLARNLAQKATAERALTEEIAED
jgi:hypothetical protein